MRTDSATATTFWNQITTCATEMSCCAHCEGCNFKHSSLISISTDVTFLEEYQTKYQVIHVLHPKNLVSVTAPQSEVQTGLLCFTPVRFHGAWSSTSAGLGQPLELQEVSLNPTPKWEKNGHQTKKTSSLYPSFGCIEGILYITLSSSSRTSPASTKEPKGRWSSFFMIAS